MDNQCGTCQFCNEGSCVQDRCCVSECSNPCAVCNRLTGGCDPIVPDPCPDPCEVCDPNASTVVCIQNPQDLCCGRFCSSPPGLICSCQPSSGQCVCIPAPT
jgi:hypothetical protein